MKIVEYNLMLMITVQLTCDLWLHLQQPQDGSRVPAPNAAQNHKAEQPSAASVPSSGESQNRGLVEERGRSAAPTAAALNAQKSTSSQPLAGSPRPTPSDGAVNTESASSSAKEDGNSPPQDTIMEEAIRLTRGRLRRTHAASNE